MATKNTNINININANPNNDNNMTKVICQNCGAEIAIPEHECVTAGIAIGKDSGLGTVVLPTEGGATNQGAKAASKFGKAAQSLSKSQLIEMVASLMEHIEDSGYIAVDGIVRRWIPSQALSMLNRKPCFTYNRRNGFHDALKARGYDYTWKVLINDLKRQMELMAEKDTEGYKDRNRWYNRQIALDMANHYVNELRGEVAQMAVRNHKGRKYVALRCRLNHGLGIHLDEIPSFFGELQTLIDAIQHSKSPKGLYDAVVKFNQVRKGIGYTPDYDNICDSFFNAYKAAGGYYTMKDLILFEGCKMKCASNGSTSFVAERYGQPKVRKFVEQEESLAALERKADEICAKGVNRSGYEMLGLLKDFLQYNDFDFEATKKEWAKQSEARKLLRNVTKNRRPRK